MSNAGLLHMVATEASTNDVSGKNLNIFKNDAFKEIKFLSDTGGQVTSVCASDGSGLAYASTNIYGDATPRWISECYQYGTSPSQRDNNHNVSPVCRIVLTEVLS